MQISLNDIGGSALTDKNINIPKYSDSNEIPITYVQEVPYFYHLHWLGLK
jgi:7-cyano-7-deazaguanine synthase in queuosine biosynthesis